MLATQRGKRRETQGQQQYGRAADARGTNQHKIAIPRLGIKCFLPLSPTRTSYVLT